MPLSDYHVHTLLCNHATGTMDACARKALSLGLSGMCFLEHLTIRPDGSHLSMSVEEVPLYFLAARQTRNRYASCLDVLVGLEVDFDPEHMGQVKKVTDTFAFDLVAGSVHFVGPRNIVSRRTGQSLPGEDAAAVVSGYLDKLEALVESGFFDVVCHLDVVKKFGRPFPCGFEDKVERIVSKIAQKGLAVELNTAGFRHAAARSYPDAWLLEKIAKAGIGMTLGSDAHAADEIGKDFDKARALLKNAGVTHLTAFSKRRSRQVAI